VISLEERERTEKIRSALQAAQKVTPLVVPAETIALYRSPSETTVFPLEYAFHLLGDVRGKTILDYGCGDGVNTVALANRGAKVIAFDISPQLLSLAKKRLDANACNEVELLLSSAHALPLEDNSIDIIFGNAILHHLDLEIASSEIRRVLKKNGKCVFKEPLRNSKLVVWVRQFFPVRAHVSPFERPLTDQEIDDFAMLCMRRARTFQLMLSRIASVLPFWSAQAVELCAYVDSYLLRRFPSLTYYGAIKVFELVKEDET
jgi:ubiquinone/menaquinone biosynthesis C-methylase UbiE